MSMHCKQCHEPFPRNQPFDLFELRRHTYLPSDPQGLTQSSVLEDGGTFCSRKCLGDYLKAGDKSGVMELGSSKNKL